MAGGPRQLKWVEEESQRAACGVCISSLPFLVEVLPAHPKFTLLSYAEAG